MIKKRTQFRVIFGVQRYWKCGQYLKWQVALNNDEAPHYFAIRDIDFFRKLNCKFNDWNICPVIESQLTFPGILEVLEFFG